MNRLIAFILLVLFSPLWGIVLLLSLLMQGRPLFFLQERIGRHKKVFSIYKLRSMHAQKITSWGKILRNTGLDEFPQLINILKGEMCFLGPRPLTSFDIERLGWDTPYHEKRWKVKPGITGLAQLYPVCNKKKSWLCDVYYCQHKSICLNLSILLQTLAVLLIGKEKLKKRKRK